ncbi:prephenate/arogenate dehydrogenase family protein [Henriciella sp.]|uniref:prephenate/arogenate dehydrogenase family protein n=1 Tax=Henriciella sp. TaxID=1968823 RepID=UPI0017A0FB5F|nr:prephenate/arogenate dehydrogenase family protein [Henriciella sp.]HIG23133.1 prephenate/arogenate dehydrogenase family protein [Henriciella sp.]
MIRPVFDRIAIIGAGLIGSSIALAARENGAAGKIAIYDANEDVRRRAGQLGLGEVCDTPAAACSDADCVILCVPVGAIESACEALAPSLKPGAILSDVGSVKEKALSAMQAHCPEGVHLIPGHPIAGTEKSGPEAGFSTLFKNAWYILTPLPQQEEAYNSALDRLAAFWEMLGSKVEIMEAGRHDRVLAITSHLPHLIAYNIVSTAYDMESVGEGEVVKYSAGGFRDFTRIAASDPTMWRDVFLNNREAVLETLGRFSEDLAALQRAIRWGDGETLMKEFERARGIRKAIIDAGQDTSDVNFGRNTSDKPKY